MLVRNNNKNTSISMCRVWLVFLSLFAIVIAGCATVPISKEFTFNALVFDNESEGELENVRIEVKKTDEFVACGTILKNTSCSTTFRARTYQGNTVYVSWQLGGREKTVGPIYIEVPQIKQYNSPARIMISFDSNDDVSARFTY